MLARVKEKYVPNRDFNFVSIRLFLCFVYEIEIFARFAFLTRPINHAKK